MKFYIASSAISNHKYVHTKIATRQQSHFVRKCFLFLIFSCCCECRPITYLPNAKHTRPKQQHFKIESYDVVVTFVRFICSYMVEKISEAFNPISNFSSFFKMKFHMRSIGRHARRLFEIYLATDLTTNY